MQNNSIAMPPAVALATPRRLYDTASIYATNAVLNYDFRQMLPPDLLEQCEQALATLAQVVSPSEPGVTGSK
jgi:hypothetical protein